MNRRQLSTIALLAALAALSGCASLNQISSEVSSYGQWPPGRAAGRYFIERLPSQAAQTPPTAQAGVTPAVPPLEAAAHGALQAAGFQRASSLETADVVLVAGKGHETTQEIAGVFHPFSDVEHLQAALAARLTQEVQA